MGSERSRAEEPARGRAGGVERGRGAPTDAQSALLARGNAGTLRVLRSFRGRSEADEEREATEVADRVAPGGAPAANQPTGASTPVAKQDAGDSSCESAHAEIGPARIHRDAAAQREAASHSALAVTRGNDVSFSRRAPAATSLAGCWLLAHELTHVAQQQLDGDGDGDGDDGPRVRRYPDPLGGGFHDPNAGVVSDVPGAIPTDLSDPTSGVDVDETVRVAAPLLAGQHARGRDREQTWHIGSAIVGPNLPISVYAVPRSRLTLDAAGARSAAGSESVPPPDLQPGTSVYAPDGSSLPVLGADAANVFIEAPTAIHFAVGAGSCVLVRTNGGWYLFDAGINITESGGLADAVVAEIAARVGSEGLRAVFLTHAHYDHISLLARLQRRMQIDAIVANPQQLTREEYVRIRDAMRVQDLLRREELRATMEADVQARADFEATLSDLDPNAETYPEEVASRWRTEVAHRVEARYPELRELAALPSRRTGEFSTVDTRPAADPSRPTMDLEEILPSGEDVDFRGVVDPDVRRGRTMRESEVDRFSTTYLLTVGESRLLVLPDIRRYDMTRIRADLERLLGRRDVTFQEWIVGHHMQGGWSGVETVSASTLRKTLELLDALRSRGAGGRDVVIASVDMSKISPAQIRLLRAIGYETFLAHSQQDVATYEFLSGGRLVRGVRGPVAAGARGEPTLRRAIAGERDLEARISIAQQQQRATPRSERGPIRQRIEDLRAQRRQIRDLQHELIEKLRASPFDEAAAAGVERQLNAALDLAQIGRVVTSSSELTDTALVLMRQPLEGEFAPGTPEAEQRARDLALAERKSRVDILRDRVNDATLTAEERQAAAVELYTEGAQYEAELQAASEAHVQGVSQDAINLELGRVRADRAALEAARTTSQPARLPDGSLVENRVVKIQAPEPSPEAGSDLVPRTLGERMLGAVETGGRAMGAVMVYSTITGSADMLDRYEAGQINTTQLALGSVRQATSAVVGVRMVTGMRVNPGVFVVMTALEIGEAATGDYDSTWQRDRAIDTAVRNGAVNLGCMAVGEALMATANPVGIVAGVAVMFLGPVLINLLFEDEGPEPLLPDEVGAVDSTLRDLLSQYQDVVGGILAERRTEAERADIGISADIRPRAEASIREHRIRALYLETQILPQFEEAYRVAREGRAGLHELDRMRQEFLEMRAQAMTDSDDEELRQDINSEYRIISGGVGGAADMGDFLGVPGMYAFSVPEETDDSGRRLTIREQTIRRFQRMEQGLSIDSLSPEEVRRMPQWHDIHAFGADLYIDIMKGEDDWADIGQRQHDLEARVANARYRIHPTGPRRQPLLHEGSPGWQAYQEQLAHVEATARIVEQTILVREFLTLRREGVEVGDIGAIAFNSQFGSRQERLLALASRALDLYELGIHQIDGPPSAVRGGADAVYRDPAAQRAYLQAFQDDRTFRVRMLRLRTNELAAQSLVQQLAESAPASSAPAGTAAGAAANDPSAALSERFRQLENERSVVRGILFQEEIQEMIARDHRRAVDYYAGRLAPSEHPLTEPEAAAFQTGEYGEAAEQAVSEPHSVRDRLAMIRDLRPPSGPEEVTDASGDVMRVYRTVPGLMRLDSLTEDQVLLVGRVSELPFDFGEDTMVEIVPINDAAVSYLGGYGTRMVTRSRLLPASEDDLSP